MSPDQVAREFIDAMNGYDADRLVGLLAPGVELHGFKGVYVGHDEARRWLGTAGPNLRSSIAITDLKTSGQRVLVVAERIWIWIEGDEEAERERWHAVWWLRDALVERWQPFHYLPEAVEAFEAVAPEQPPDAQ